MNTQEILTSLYKVQIRNWVLKNFGISELEDPSWNIEALAEELATHAYTVYSIIEDNGLYEDVQYVAEAYNGKKLDKKHAERAVGYYKNMDAYGELDKEAIKWAIKQTEEKT